jgi:hypothetical protein
MSARELMFAMKMRSCFLYTKSGLLITIRDKEKRQDRKKEAAMCAALAETKVQLNWKKKGQKWEQSRIDLNFFNVYA